MAISRNVALTTEVQHLLGFIHIKRNLELYRSMSKPKTVHTTRGREASSVNWLHTTSENIPRFRQERTFQYPGKVVQRLIKHKSHSNINSDMRGAWTFCAMREWQHSLRLKAPFQVHPHLLLLEMNFWLATRNRQAVAYSPQSWPLFCWWTVGTVMPMCPLVVAFWYIVRSCCCSSSGTSSFLLYWKLYSLTSPSR